MLLWLLALLTLDYGILTLLLKTKKTHQLSSLHKSDGSLNYTYEASIT
jgi:hypothetical protein